MSEDSFASVARTPMPPGYEGEKKERGDSDEDLADFNRNVGKVIEALRTDYPRMFFDALNFEIYTDDLELIDPVRERGRTRDNPESHVKGPLWM